MGNTCSDDGISTNYYSGGDCSGTALETESFYEASDCTEMTCSGSSDDIGDVDSSLYLSVGRQRRNKREYMCEALQSGLIPWPHLHHQPHPHIPMAPVAAPDSF